MNLITCYCDLTNNLKPYISAIDYYNNFIIVSTKKIQVSSNADFEDDFVYNGVPAWIDEIENSLLIILFNYTSIKLRF